MLLFSDGVDHYTDPTQKWDVVQTFGTTLAISPTAGRNGRAGFLIQDPQTAPAGQNYGELGSTQWIPASASILIVGWDVTINFTNVGVAPSGVILQRFVYQGVTQIDLRLDPSGVLYFTRGGQLLAQSVNTLTGGDHYLEALVQIDPQNGICELHVDSGSWIAQGGLNTQSAAAPYIDTVFLGMRAVAASGTVFSSMAIDDIYFADFRGQQNNNFLDDTVVDTFMPLSDGSLLMWGASGSTVNPNVYQQVNEVPPDEDATYLFGTGQGTAELFHFSAPAATGIHAVNEWIRAREDAAGPEPLSGLVFTGTDYDARGGLTPVSAYKYGSAIWELNPSTGMPWTASGLLGSQFGFELTPSATGFDLSAFPPGKFVAVYPTVAFASDVSNQGAAGASADGKSDFLTVTRLRENLGNAPPFASVSHFALPSWLSQSRVTKIIAVFWDMRLIGGNNGTVFDHITTQNGTGGLFLPGSGALSTSTPKQYSTLLLSPTIGLPDPTVVDLTQIGCDCNNVSSINASYSDVYEMAMVLAVYYN